MSGDMFMALAFLAIVAFIYFMPTIVAAGNKHRSLGAVFALNLLLGWTFVFWVIALVWALTNQGEPRVSR